MQKTAYKLGLVFFPAFDWCITPDHPEREERLLYTRDQIEEEGLFDVDGIVEYRPFVADNSVIQRTHICVPRLNTHVTESHRIAVGGTIVAADLVIDKKVDRSFALLRPPGHHANRVVHGPRGFCTVNNEAIMVEHIRHRLGPKTKIAIVDTDAHHADGTQDIFYNDPGVLHISLHQDGRTLYPGTGHLSERGGPGAYGQTVNIPLPPGTGDAGMLYVMEQVVLPILKEWQPDLIVNAAGQDNHFSDPLTNMNFSAHGYAQLTEMLSPDIVVLEGGYSIEGALPYVNVGLLLALAGLDYSKVKEPDWNEKASAQTRRVTNQISEIVDIVQNQWATRDEADLEELFGKGPLYERRRGIYYDTAGVSESQQEYIRLCSDCPGWRIIYSVSDRYRVPIGAVLVPWNVCPRCEQEAEMQYDAACENKELDQVFFQNPEKDIFLNHKF